MDQHVYPNEARFRAEIAAGDRWQPTRDVESLKAEAQGRDCGICFCPRAIRRRPHQRRIRAALRDHGPRLGFCAEVFNCSAPDTGNMEVLVRYGTADQKRNGWSLCWPADSLVLCHDRARRRLVRRHQHPRQHHP